MAVHLIENLYQIGGEGLTHRLDGASYLLFDEQYPENSVMVDCGGPLGFEELTHRLKSFDLTPAQLAGVYATHCHFDHIAAAAQMEATPVYIHEGEHDAIADQSIDRTAAFLYANEFPSIKNIENLEHGTEISIGKTVLKALHTPGHTPGSMSYKVTTEDGSRVLLAGDTLWGGYHPRIRSSFDKWSNSLDALSREGFDLLSFGHGIQHLIPNAPAHIALAQSRFMGDVRISHGGQYYDPWAETHTCK